MWNSKESFGDADVAVTRISRNIHIPKLYTPSTPSPPPHPQRPPTGIFVSRVSDDFNRIGKKIYTYTEKRNNNNSQLDSRVVRGDDERRRRSEGGLRGEIRNYVYVDIEFLRFSESRVGFRVSSRKRKIKRPESHFGITVVLYVYVPGGRGWGGGGCTDM